MNEDPRSKSPITAKAYLVVVLLCLIILLQVGILFQGRMKNQNKAPRSSITLSTPSGSSRWFSKLMPWRRSPPPQSVTTPDTVWDSSRRMADMHSQINRLFEQAFRDSFRFPTAPAVASPPPATSIGSAPPDPFIMMRDMRREIDGMFMEALHDMTGHAHGFDDGWSELALTPGIRVSDTGETYEIIVALPSVDKSDIHLGMDGSILTLVVDHSETRNEQATNTAKRAVYSQQIRRFEQRLRLPGADSTPGRIHAAFENGLLRVVVPRQTGNNPSSGTIQVN